MAIEAAQNGSDVTQATPPAEVPTPIPPTPPSTSEVIAATRHTLTAMGETLVKYGIMQKWEVDHFFGPIYTHLSER